MTFKPPLAELEGPVIAIDGPAGAGKSTAARTLAERMGYALLDTGAIYRAVAVHLERLRIGPDEEVIPASALRSVALRLETSERPPRVILGSDDITELIRDERVAGLASRFSAKPEVREALLGFQRDLARRGRMVVEGRDMGTVVFPDAQVKFFITADLKERARRRYLELIAAGLEVESGQVLDEMRARDARDFSRKTSPLTKAPDSIEIDTGGMSPEEVVENMLKVINGTFDKSAVKQRC